MLIQTPTRFLQSKIFDQSAEIRKGSEIRPFPPEDGRFTLEFYHPENLSIGPCVVSVVHYNIQEQATVWPYKDNSKSEVWFSPDLGANVRTIAQLKDNNVNEKQIETKLTSITTEFKPIKP